MILNFIKSILRNFYDSNEAFIKKLRKQGANVGRNVQIVDKKNFLYEPWCANLIEIQDEVIIAAGVRLVSHDSSYANIADDLPTKYGKIIIEKKAYIGVNSTILPGVVIGTGSLIGAGSVVNRNIPPRSVAVGNPVKIVSTVDEGIKKYMERCESNTNPLLYYLHLGGSYSQMLDKHGKGVNTFIMKKYNDFFKHGEPG
jgi:maltose O-acetyltransferase